MWNDTCLVGHENMLQNPLSCQMQGSVGIPRLPGIALHLSTIESSSQPRYTALRLTPGGYFCRIKSLECFPLFRRQAAPSSISRVLAPHCLAPFFNLCFPPLAAAQHILHWPPAEMPMHPWGPGGVPNSCTAPCTPP